MSTQPVSSNQGALSSGASGVGAGSLLQITGLASSLDTNAIINALMAIDRQPVIALTKRQTGLNALNAQLTGIQSSLQTLAINAQALASPTLFASAQTASSSDPTRVSATTTAGAVVGGYQVAVTQLAKSSQRTFAFDSSTGGSLTVDGGPSVTVSAGESIQDFVNSINSGANLDVWAAATDATHVVLSTRATGAPGAGGYISVSQTGTSLTEDATKALPGQNAAYTIDGTPGSSAKNSVDGTTGGPFIPGVTLTLSGVTTTSGPVTVNVTPPAPNADSITAAVKAFVDSYNSVLDQINTQITQKTSTTDPTQGLLFGDSDLTSLRDSMRQAVYTSIAGLTGITSLADIGVSTGAASGAATYSQDAVDGKLTIDTTALTNAIQSNPSGVKQMLQSWSQNFAGLVNSVAAPGGSLDARIQGDNTELSDISNQIDNLNAILANRQTALQTQFANLEAVLSQHQAQSNWLAGQIAQLP